MMKHHMMDIEKKILDLKLAHIDVQHDLYLDALVIRHTATKTAKKISRYEIERLRDPYPIILEIIGEVMAVPLDVLHEIIKQSQAANLMIGSPTENWSEFLNWFTSLKLDGIVIDVDFPTDSLNIRNTNTNMVTRISRMVIESMEPSYRRQAIMETIAQMLPTTGSVSTGALGSSTTLPYTIATGGNGGIQHIVNSGGGGGIGAVGSGMNHYWEYKEEPKIDPKMKLFSYAEQFQIMEVKKSIRSHIEKHMPIHQFDMSSVVIAGGCFASMLNGEVVKDFDVFLLESETNRAALASIETIENGLNPNVIKVSGSEYMNNDKIEKVVTFGSNAIQYISTKYKNRLELIEHFDFKHCCVSYDYKVDRLFITRETFDLIKSKTLEPNTDKAPAYWRYEKFWQRGWKSEIAIATD
jgi:hypothetical protein